MKKNIIGIVGVKTSGKSTVTNIIRKILGENNAKEAALADKLKNTCSSVFGVSRESFDKQELKETPFACPKILTEDKIVSVLDRFNVAITSDLISKYDGMLNMKLDSPRHIAQVVGTEVLRAAGDEDIHCKNLHLYENGITTIISDVRFPNEFDFFSKKEDANFIPIYIQRDEAEAKITPNSHPSETSVFIFRDRCILVPNNSSVEILTARIYSVLTRTDVRF